MCRYLLVCSRFFGGDVWKQNCCHTPIPCLIFPGTSRPFPQEPHHSTSPPAVHQGSDFSTPSPTWVSFWFFVVAILMGMRGISGVSAGTFLTMVMNIFSDAFGHLCISSGEISIKSLACFVCFLLLSGPTSKLRPDLRPHCPSALDYPPIWYFCPGRDPTAPQTEVYELSSTSIPHTPSTVHWHNSVALPTKEISNLLLSSKVSRQTRIKSKPPHHVLQGPSLPLPILSPTRYFLFRH